MRLEMRKGLFVRMGKGMDRLDEPVLWKAIDRATPAGSETDEAGEDVRDEAWARAGRDVVVVVVGA
jgi:hypothetical protein